ncbi:MAG TPA: VOC family protein [Terriglobales bacterium]|nr:VOC family protein [Terriglobales bacterium]
MAKKAAKKALKKRPATARKSIPAKKKIKVNLSTRPKKLASAVTSSAGDKLTFNHAMIYCKDVRRSLGFYRDLLGLNLIEDFQHEGASIYARLKAPGGDGTIALHLAGPGTPIASEGVRLYFEIREVDDFCRKLQAKGFYITQMPRVMPWGWRHAYLNDPDGHEISLYWAGEMRMEKTVMKAAREAEKTPSATR